MIADAYPHLEREVVYRLADAPQPPVDDFFDSTPPSVDNPFEDAERRVCSVCSRVVRIPPFALIDDIRGHCTVCEQQVEWRPIAP